MRHAAIAIGAARDTNARTKVVQPHVGDPVFHGRGAPSVFDVPCNQRHLDEGIWEVLFEEDGMPVKIRHHEGGWKVAYR